ncbi:class I SAM-dependent methyltransferase [Adlercreutzia muris]|uniref:class I SAM-dependent methyltransferase n=1 Tax=Adlercreutzia muris TaxID=1796610 RepID=UPI0021D5E12A|nr:class I SAM-dependent methyltransferase [Adlercreutzia muris]MCU7583759.1 class I SAM-dependent methyltransferase [Adlercreutzia muris]
MSINEYIAKQFANPRGIGGRIVMAVMNRQNAQMYEETERLLRPRNDDIILDIGCGNGIMLERIVHACDCHLIGTDISEDALEIAKRRLAGTNVELLRCPVDDTPLEDATVDKALTINTIYFWEDLASGFEEIARVLKPEGIFTSTHYTNRALESYSHTQFGYRMRTEQEVVSAAEIAGFTVQIKSIMDGRAYCVVGRRQA